MLKGRFRDHCRKNPFMGLGSLFGNAKDSRTSGEFLYALMPLFFFKKHCNFLALYSTHRQITTIHRQKTGFQRIISFCSKRSKTFTLNFLENVFKKKINRVAIGNISTIAFIQVLATIRKQNYEENFRSRFYFTIN